MPDKPSQCLNFPIISDEEGEVEHQWQMDLDCHHCGGRGHLARGCPDHWRRYHLTTTPGKVVKPDEPAVPYSKVW